MHGGFGAPADDAVDWQDPNNAGLAKVVLEAGGVPAAEAAFGVSRNSLVGWAHRRGVRPAPAREAAKLSARELFARLRAAGVTRLHLTLKDGRTAGTPVTSRDLSVTSADAWESAYLSRVTARRGHGGGRSAAPPPVTVSAPAEAEPPVEAARPAVEEPEPVEDVEDVEVEGAEVEEESAATPDAYDLTALRARFPRVVEMRLTRQVGSAQQCRTPLWGLDPACLLPKSGRRVTYRATTRFERDAPGPRYVCGEATPSPSDFFCEACQRELYAPAYSKARAPKFAR